jgi:hypothetical protein
MKTCDCLKWKYKGNGHLEAGKVSLAIDAYDKALATDVSQQEGIILLMRATAYLQRAGPLRFGIMLVQSGRTRQYRWIRLARLIRRIDRIPDSPGSSVTAGKLPLEFRHTLESFAHRFERDRLFTGRFVRHDTVHDGGSFTLERKEISQIPSSRKGVGLQGFERTQGIGIRRSRESQLPTIVLAVQ